MGIASQPSKLSLPQHNPSVVTVLDYLIKKFPAIKPLVWQQRVYYSREVESEAIIPFTEAVLFQDEHILVAPKPHFLALMPGGFLSMNACKTDCD